MYSDDDIAKLKKATQILQLQWHTQHCGEKKIASTTSKMHNLLFHLIPQATYLGKFFHFMEDPIESLHHKDKELNRIFAVATSFEKRVLSQSGTGSTRPMYVTQISHRVTRPKTSLGREQ
eukprot:6940887-Ditylum_brightwellii.AAC.2